MSALWLSLSGLLGIALAIVYLPLLRQRQPLAAVTHQQHSIAIFKDRLAELESEKNQGTLAAGDFVLLKAELEKSLLADVDSLNPPQPPFEKGGDDFKAPFIKGGEVTLQHWLIVSGLAFFVVLVSLTMYVQLGRSEDFAQSLVLQAKAQQQAVEDEKARAQLVKLVTLLKAKIAQHPTDVEKWQLLANSYAAMQQYSQAAQVYQAAMTAVGKQHPQYAALKGGFAQMLFQAADEHITPAVAQAMQETLAIDPLESSALLLKGIEAYTQGRVAQAIEAWKQAKIKANDNLIANFIDPIITQAQAQLAQMPAVSAAKITVKVSLDNRLKNKLNPEQIVFVFARAVDGKMPLAIEKLQVKDLPSTVVLDDTKAAMPTARLSSVQTAQVTARVSLSGQAREASGDWFASPVQVSVNKEGSTVELLINQQVP
jgi:cytochrome c-type biogenesis protein CcmH